MPYYALSSIIVVWPDAQSRSMTVMKLFDIILNDLRSNVH